MNLVDNCRATHHLALVGLDPHEAHRRLCDNLSDLLGSGCSSSFFSSDSFKAQCLKRIAGQKSRSGL